MSQWPTHTRRAKTTFGELNRSELMSRVRSTGNVTTEFKLLQLLRTNRIGGWRRNYPLIGKPDFVFPSVRVAVFVDGCFWHGHNCGRNLTPRKNMTQWRAKFRATEHRDRKIRRALRAQDWRVVTIWECCLQRKPNECIQKLQKVLQSNCRA